LQYGAEVKGNARSVVTMKYPEFESDDEDDEDEDDDNGGRVVGQSGGRARGERADGDARRWA
jgi:hypothetical protein